MGYLGGREVFGWVGAYAPMIAFILQLLIGNKIIFESFSGNIETVIENNFEKKITNGITNDVKKELTKETTKNITKDSVNITH